MISRRSGISASSSEADETVQHMLGTGLLEVDLQLVALNCPDKAVAELLVEDSRTDADIAAAFVANAHRALPRLYNPHRLAHKLALRALPAGATPSAARDVGEGIVPLGPVGP